MRKGVGLGAQKLRAHGSGVIRGVGVKGFEGKDLDGYSMGTLL